jgi:nucleoside-diphosphate-sugar epimerase
MQTSQKIVVTGAGGFIGGALLKSLANKPLDIHALVRRFDEGLSPAITQHIIQDLVSANSDDLAEAMNGVRCLIHLAAVVPGKGANDTSNATVEMARTVAKAAADAKVDRVIVLSSAYAELAERGNPSARQYGHDKLAADRIFASYLPQSTIILLRPPVVYGSGMRGSLLTLAKMISKGFWLPLGLARNERSYISITNLVHLLAYLVALNAAQWQTVNGRAYVPTDGHPVSTVDLIRVIADSVEMPPRIFPIPLPILRLLGKITGKAEVISGAIDPLRYNDNEKLFSDIGWAPIESFPASHITWPHNAIGS